MNTIRRWCAAPFTTAFALLCSDSFGAGTPPDLLFRATFDEAFSSHAVYSRGDKTCSLTEDLGLRGQQGIVKNALLIEPGESCFYQAKGNINLRQGTVSFWLRPANWDTRTIGTASLFRVIVTGRRFQLEIEKDGGVQSISANLAPDAPRDATQTRGIHLKASVDYHKNRWTKIDVTWTDSTLALYADGRLANRTTFAPISLPQGGQDGRIQITPGKSAWRTAIDEIEIFDRPQDAATILGRYEAVTGKPSGESIAPARLVFLPHVSVGKLGIVVEFDDAALAERWAPRAGSAPAAIEVTGPDGSITKQASTFGGATEPCWLPFRFADGPHTVKLTLRDPASGQSLDIPGAFTKPPTPWLGAQCGVTDDVLDPWTPLEFPDDRTAACHGRRYTFDGPFLRAVENRGHPLLRAPMRLQIETDQGRGAFEETARRVVRHAPNRAEFSGEGRFGDSGCRLQWENWIEFDGATYSTFTLVPPDGGCEVKSLRLQVPLRADVMRFERGRQSVPAARSIEGTAYEIPEFREHLWFCNEEEGFAYFADCDANWVRESGAAAFAVDAKDDPGFEIRLIARPVRVTGPIRYELGFEATPVKPPLPGWRTHRFGNAGVAETNGAPRNAVYVKNSDAQDGLWSPEPVARMRERVAQAAEHGVRQYWYSYLGATPDHNPVYDFFAAVWHCPAGPTYGPFTRQKQSFRLRPVEPGHPAYVDYVTSLADRMQRELGPVCLYTDGFHNHHPIEGQANPWSGFLTRDAFGRTVYRYQLLGIRDYAKRVATILRRHTGPGPRGLWMGHNHSRFIAPCHGFCDWFFPGEEYTQTILRSGNPYYYIDEMPEQQWRTGFATLPTGVVHIVLPELTRSGVAPRAQLRADRGPTDALLAMCAVHDLNLRGNENPEAIAEWLDLRDRLGITADAARFTGWWQPDCPVRTQTPKALASVYRLDRRAVIPVANRQPQPADIMLELDFPARNARDERSGKTLPVSHGKVVVPLPPRNYTYLTVDFEPAP